MVPRARFQGKSVSKRAAHLSRGAVSAASTTVQVVEARFAPFANRFCPTCGRPMEQAWKRQADGTFEPIEFDWCEPCEIGLASDAPWPVDLRVVGPNYPGHPDDAEG
jgi:NADH pyrophosphatase NudC (nudix superfamily)